MIRRLLLACFLLPFLASAQNVQWAAEVVDFSSELTDIQYGASQVLGKPNVLPVGGESPNAWTPDKPNRTEFLKVRFNNPMRISQVMIAESYNPSAVTNVYGYDATDREYLLWTFEPADLSLESRLLTAVFDMTTFSVAAIKVELDGSRVDEYYSIDAIGISDSPQPYEVLVELPDNLNSEINTERLSEKVNSPYKEYKPLLSPDGKTLYFSRQNHPENAGGEADPEDIWYSELDENGEWTEAQNAENLNTPGPNFISALTPDGNSVVMLLGNRYKDNGKLAAGVSVATKEGDKWGDPQNLDIVNDYNYNEKANYFLTQNRQVLFLSVERDDTRGDRDLYVSFLMDDGKWSEPLNIGSNVNTSNEESAPFLAADNETLYFSSNGYSGFGGHDIYVTRRLDDTWTSWSDPENMGSDINTDQEDLFFYIPVTGNYAYYSRGVNETDADVYRVELPIQIMPARVVVLKGKLQNSETGEPIEATVVYERLSDGNQVGVTKSNPETGEYEIVLPVGESYGFYAESDGFLPISENIDLTEVGDDELNQERDLQLVPVTVTAGADSVTTDDPTSDPVATNPDPSPTTGGGATIVMNNVFFDFDRSDVKPESRSELERISDFMSGNSGVKIEIAGHTDSTGPPEYNLDLSRRRAQAVKDYIVARGINGTRVDVKFFGETNPIATNANREGRRQNRRVEFKIVQ